MPKTRSAPAQTSYLLIDGLRIPVYITTERRRDCRVSIGKTGIHVRLAAGMRDEQRLRQTRELLDWARDKVREKGWSQEEPNRLYHHGDLLRLGGELFRVEVEPGALRFQVGRDLEPEERSRIMSELAAKVAMRYFGRWFRDRVALLNRCYYGYPYNQVRLKHNSTNWGSCSAKGNINLNVRLLFAPVEVLDYVIVHELAHLRRQDHSPAFWRLVETALPHYREYVHWLKAHGQQCVF
jgi:predicted metal-dependent hydrolase